MKEFSNTSVFSTMLITGAFSGILFDWGAYGFSMGVGIPALMCMGLLVMRYIWGDLK